MLLFFFVGDDGGCMRFVTEVDMKSESRSGGVLLMGLVLMETGGWKLTGRRRFGCWSGGEVVVEVVVEMKVAVVGIEGENMEKVMETERAIRSKENASEKDGDKT